MANLVIGFRTYLEGVFWLRRHLGLAVLLLMPALFGIAIFFSLLGTVWSYRGDLFTLLIFSPPEAWWGPPVVVFLKLLLSLALLVLSALVAVALVSAFAAPLYEYVSARVERDLTGVPSPEVTLWRSLLLIKEEMKKTFFIISLSILLLLIPGVNVISTVVAAFLAGWDFYDLPLARRGWTFRQRWGQVQRDGFAVLGLGLWLVIPFLQLVTWPFAVVGGTMLSVRRLQAEGQAHITAVK